uniref:Uncharacterized protein n=1 Tax=Coccidioides posadasii RMSCC 3488 TaxID=454284 RepID=A0A0J6IKA3_COCPO|nr:hypothetical protein CPAG_08662 [Coccidioides posadasii RMSCC 3488]
MKQLGAYGGHKRKIAPIFGFAAVSKAFSASSSINRLVTSLFRSMMPFSTSLVARGQVLLYRYRDCKSMHNVTSPIGPTAVITTASPSRNLLHSLAPKATLKGSSNVQFS